jgi:methanogenic corrinoid protein MtbC1
MGIGLTSSENDVAAALAAHPDPQRAEAGVSRPWAEMLGEAIQSEILPHLLTAHREFPENPAEPVSGTFNLAEIAAFVDLVVADDMEQVRAVADRVIVQSGGRDALINDLLGPAARLLGVMWERDTCDFMSVTLGVYRLDQIMRETALAGQMEPLGHAYENRILLLPAPGEQHSFGLGMVSDAFREGGWCVRSGPAVSRAQLARLVKDEWFDVIGLSVTTDRWLKGLPSCIRAVRKASCNPGVFIMVGGHAIISHSERTRFLGADAAAADARDALQQANIYVESTVTRGLQQFKTRLIDAG